MGWDVVGALGLMLTLIGLLQFSVTIFAGRAGYRQAQRRERDPLPVVETGEFNVAFLLPALNEAAVIGPTVRAALELYPYSMLVLIDDGSDDGTADIAAAAAAEIGVVEGGGRLLIVRRRAPNARRGKGAALNAGYQVLLAATSDADLDPSSVLVCVMDADGRLSPGTVEHVARIFADPRVGGVQLPVSIRNRRSLLGTFQDCEFWAMSALQQHSRSFTGSVSLGGNGQFTRLSALLPHAEPWRDSLTEDLDLAITLICDGWRLDTTAAAYVDQQAVEELWPLLRQRTRWLQGHVLAARRVGEVWRAKGLSELTVLEVTNYLTVPILMILPWSIIFNLGLIRTIMLVAAAGEEAWSLRLLRISAWWLFSFFPNFVSGLWYWRRRRGEVSVVRALGVSHLFVIYNYVTFVAAWRALGRILRGRHGWAKTAHLHEVATG